MLTIAKKNIPFINDTIHERLDNGSIEYIGKVNEVDPPHIVVPLTVEPSKPRLCINLMYLNNWIRDIHFTLDTLKHIPRIVKTMPTLRLLMINLVSTTCF